MRDPSLTSDGASPYSNLVVEGVEEDALELGRASGVRGENGIRDGFGYFEWF